MKSPARTLPAGSANVSRKSSSDIPPPIPVSPAALDRDSRARTRRQHRPDSKSVSSLCLPSPAHVWLSWSLRGKSILIEGQRPPAQLNALEVLVAFKKYSIVARADDGLVPEFGGKLDYQWVGAGEIRGGALSFRGCKPPQPVHGLRQPLDQIRGGGPGVAHPVSHRLGHPPVEVHRAAGGIARRQALG